MSESSPVMYLVFAIEPMEMEGADRFIALFSDKAVAEEAAEKWTADEAAALKIKTPVMWQSFASTYYVEARRVQAAIPSEAPENSYL